MEAAEAIAAVEGIERLLIGPANPTGAWGRRTSDDPDLAAAMTRVDAVCAATGNDPVTRVRDGRRAESVGRRFRTTSILSDRLWMRRRARVVAAGIRGLAGA